MFHGIPVFKMMVNATNFHRLIERVWDVFEIASLYTHRRRSRKAKVSVAPQTKSPPSPHVLLLKDCYGCICQYLWHQRLQSAHFLPSDDSRTTWEVPRSRIAWKSANWCMGHKSITDKLDTVKIRQRGWRVMDMIALFLSILTSRLSRFYLIKKVY